MGTKSSWLLLGGAIILLSLSLSGGAAASEMDVEPYRERPMPELDQPETPWQYETYYFFGLTRGLDEEVASPVGRGFSMIGTIPLDICILPAAAFAGLFG
jgi:hypothetical protein